MMPPVEVDPRTPEAIRKEAQRLRDMAMGVERKEIRFSARELDLARFGCIVRAGVAEPYELSEYVLTLVRRDYERLVAQMTEIQGTICGQCNKPLPMGCQGLFKGEAPCWFTRGPASLML